MLMKHVPVYFRTCFFVVVRLSFWISRVGDDFEPKRRRAERVAVSVPLSRIDLERAVALSKAKSTCTLKLSLDIGTHLECFSI